MSRDLMANDYWIMSQLEGIRMLEQELADAMRKPRRGGAKHLHRRVAQLSSWVDMVDRALTVRAHGHLAKSH